MQRFGYRSHKHNLNEVVEAFLQGGTTLLTINILLHSIHLEGESQIHF